MKLPIRKTIALAVTVAYIGMSIFSIIKQVNVPEGFTSTTAIIIGYYFGKSTALDSPTQQERNIYS
jgi:hypothetical protein